MYCVMRASAPSLHNVYRRMRRVVAEEVSLSMPASVNDDKCEGDSK